MSTWEELSVLDSIGATDPTLVEKYRAGERKLAEPGPRIARGEVTAHGETYPCATLDDFLKHGFFAEIDAGFFQDIPWNRCIDVWWPVDPSYEVRIGAGGKLPAGAITEENPMLAARYGCEQEPDLRVCGYIVCGDRISSDGYWLPFTDPSGTPNALVWNRGSTTPVCVIG
jgi:hypothetical protein